MPETKSQQDIVKRFMRTLDVTTASDKTALDQAINYATGGYFSDTTTLINQMISDCKNLGANKFLLQKCGINLSNTDTGAITGSDAGGTKIKTAESVVPESGKLDTSFTGTSFTTKRGLTFRLEKTNLSTTEKFIWRAIKTWWAEESLKLIENSFGYSFKDTDAAPKEITVIFKNEPRMGYLAYTGYPQNINGHYTLSIVINNAYFGNISTSNVNGKSSNAPSYLDRTIAHELTHAIMMAKVNNYKKLPVFIREGVADLTRGQDDLRTSVIKNLASNYNTLKNALDFTSSSSTADTYSAGYIFLRYLAKQGAENYSADTDSAVTVKGAVMAAGKNFSGKVLDLDDYSSAVKKVKAASVTKSIIIYGNDKANSIAAGSGNDTIYGGKGNDSLSGGKGKDVFVYNEGKDVITDYTADDKISFSVEISQTTLDGSDVVFTLGEGSLTVKDAKGKTLNIVNSADKSYSTVLGGKTLTLTNSATSPVTVGSSIKTIDASQRTKSIKITGNKFANIISGGSKNDSLSGGEGNDKIYGGNGNDCIIGGAGNDSLWGDDGADKFVYSSGDGDDIIYGFDDNDTLTFNNISFKASYSKKDNAVTFKAGSGSVTLEDFTATTFHVNNDTYKISGNKFVRK